MEFGLFNMLASQPWLFIGLSVVLGLLIGSFLNVVIYRLPIMMDNELRAECAALAESEKPPEPAPAPSLQTELALTEPEVAAADVQAVSKPVPAPVGSPPFNIIVPRSACPKCKAPISALQNIPVVSWLALRGRCASCKTPISSRYPLLELATGILSGFIAWRFGFGMAGVSALVLTWFLIALTMIDFDTQYLPDALTYPLLWLGLMVSLWHPAWGNGAEPLGPRDSIIGALAGYLSLWSVYWAFKLITGKEGMGYGDFKLFAALGAWLGWQMLLPTIVLASGMGAIVGIVVMIRQRKGRDTVIPFGPFLAIAGWIALVAGNDLVDRYLTLFWQPG